MIQTVEAIVDAAGRVQLLGEVRVAGPRRALVTVLDEPAIVPGETALLAQNAFQRPLPAGFAPAVPVTVALRTHRNP
jgi:hypothetical protein